MKRFRSSPVLAGFLGLLLPGWLLGHSALESVPRNDEWWKNRHALLNQRAAEAGEKAEVIFIGDSITQGWEGEGQEVWEKYYAPRQAVNLGIGGDRTQHVLWRLENGNLQGLKPKVAVVMIGTNNSNGEDNTVSQIAEGVAAIVQKLRRALPNTKILLLGIFPRGENPNPQRGKILQVNQVLERLANDSSIVWIDFGSRFVDAAGLIPRSLMPDFLHLSPPGYQLWAEAIEPTLTQLVGPPAAPVVSDLTGEWVFTTPGPEGEPISFPLELKQAGDKLTGRFARGEGQWLPIEEGKIVGPEVSWIVKRDRQEGGSMTYLMRGRFENGQLSGETRTDFGGNEVTSAWSAKRK